MGGSRPNHLNFFQFCLKFLEEEWRVQVHKRFLDYLWVFIYFSNPSCSPSTSINAIEILILWTYCSAEEKIATCFKKERNSLTYFDFVYKKPCNKIATISSGTLTKTHCIFLDCVRIHLPHIEIQLLITTFSVYQEPFTMIGWDNRSKCFLKK